MILICVTRHLDFVYSVIQHSVYRDHSNTVIECGEYTELIVCYHTALHVCVCVCVCVFKLHVCAYQLACSVCMCVYFYVGQNISCCTYDEIHPFDNVILSYHTVMFSCCFIYVNALKMHLWYLHNWDPTSQDIAILQEQPHAWTYMHIHRIEIARLVLKQYER